MLLQFYLIGIRNFKAKALNKAPYKTGCLTRTYLGRADVDRTTFKSGDMVGIAVQHVVHRIQLNGEIVSVVESS